MVKTVNEQGEKQMRKRFEAQYELGATPIGEVKFPERSRDEMPAVLRALQYIYTKPDLNEKVFCLYNTVKPITNQTSGHSFYNGLP